MTIKPTLKTSFESKHVIEPFFNSLQLAESIDRSCYISYANNQIKLVNKKNAQVLFSVPECCDQEPHHEDEDADEIINFAASNSGEDNHLAIAFKSGLIRLYQWNLIDSDELPAYISINDVAPKYNVKMIKCWKSSHIGPIVMMKFDPNGSNLLATGGSDGNVIVWDLVGQYVTHFLKGCKGVITLIEFEQNPNDDQYLLSIAGSHDYKVNVWDLRSSKLLATFDAHCSEVTGAAFFKPGNHFESKNQVDTPQSNETLLVTCSRDKIAIVWSITEKKAVRKIPIYDSISSLILIEKETKFSFLKPEMIKGRLIAVAGEKGELSFWDTESGVCQVKIRVCPSKSSIATKKSEESDVKEKQTESSAQLITQLIYNHKSNELTVVTYEHNILVFDLNEIKLIKTFAGDNDEILDLKLFGSDEQFVAVATNSCTLKVFNKNSSSCSLTSAHDDIIIGLQTFTADTNLIATCSKDQTFKIWYFDEKTLKVHCLFKGLGHNSSVTALGAPFLSTNWIISGSEDNTIKIWSIPTYSRESESIVAQNLISQSTVHAHDKLINCIAISPNDRLVATCSNDKLAKIWKFDSETFSVTLLGNLSGHRRAVWSTIFSPVDQVLATSSADSTIKLWSLADYSCLRTFQGHDSSVFKVLFATRSLQLITSSSDGNVKIWNVKDGECVTTIDAHSDKIYALAMSQDEQTLISGSFDSQVKIWRDVSVQKAEESKKATEKQMEAQSLLQNLIRKRQWKKAVTFSLLLNQPFTTLNIFKEMMFDLPSNDDRVNAFQEILFKLNDKQMTSILNYTVLWNTSHRHCEATQLLLSSAVKVYGEKLFTFSNSPEIVQKLEPYLKKHFQRLDRLMQTVTFFDFLYSNMKLEEQRV